MRSGQQKQQLNSWHTLKAKVMMRHRHTQNTTRVCPLMASPRRRISLLSGRYHVFCEHVEANFVQYQDLLGLIATLDGNTLWFKFNLGVSTGMMKVQRPYEMNMGHAMTVTLCQDGQMSMRCVILTQRIALARPMGFSS
jgi:hypothetical protein